MGILIASMIWGFSEATLFFIIPDVLLTAIAIKSGKKAMFACVYTLIGALIGGTIMYSWGAHDLNGALNILEKVPAINPAMIKEVGLSLSRDGLLAMVLGPIQGIPYKIYATTASFSGISFLTFLLASIPARFGRFFLLCLATWAISKYVVGKWSLKQKYILWAIAWVIIYIVYFWNHPS